MSKKPVSRIILFSVLALLLLVCLVISVIDQARQGAIRARFKPERYITMNGPAEKNGNTAVIPQTEQSTPELHVAIAPIFSPEISLRLYKDIIDYLGENLGMRAVIVQRNTYADINEALRDGICQIAFVCTFPYIRGEKDFGMEALAVPQIAGQTTYHALIIVSRTSSAQSLLDLRGKPFATVGIFSSTGWLYPATWLAQRGENPNFFFSSMVITGSHNGSIEAIANGDAEAASVHSIVYDQMVHEDSSLSRKVRVIQSSPAYGAPPIVFHPKLDPALKTRISEVLLRMHEDPVGQKALLKPRIEKYVKPDKEMYRSVSEAVKEFEALK